LRVTGLVRHFQAEVDTHELRLNEANVVEGRAPDLEQRVRSECANAQSAKTGLQTAAASRTRKKRLRRKTF
jgi:hypothetical protein